MVASAPVVGTGIGGTHTVLDIDGIPVFVKRVPLTDLERRPEHHMSTANLFDLPLGCQYGIGSPSFGVWRELAANVTATAWAEAGRLDCVPLLHHWRVLDGPASAGPLADELADVDRAVARWGGSSAVGHRITAINTSTATVALFLEHVPHDLARWLRARLADVSDGGDDDGGAGALAHVERSLRRDIPNLGALGLFHFDAHFGNLLTDGRRLLVADFGLATSPAFDLSDAERRFLHANRSHDVAHTLTWLVDWLLIELAGARDFDRREDAIRRCAAGRPVDGLTGAAAAIITRYAPIALVVNAFYRTLIEDDRGAAYPTDAVDAACAAAAVERPWTTDAWPTARR